MPLLLSLLFWVLPPAYAAVQTELKAPDLLTMKETTVSAGKRGLVVVFLSAVCPCSNSHLEELSALAKENPEFTFVGVHSNVDESIEKSKTYFEKAKLPFVVLQDEKAKLADQFKALKTPHAFVVTAEGTVYRGGVSSSKQFDQADRKYLREALEDLREGRPVRTPEGRTLGCVISRGEKFVW